MRVLMVAAENGALPGFKVGGVADVLRDLPVALAALGCEVSVVCPSHGLLPQLDEPLLEHSLEVTFRGRRDAMALWRVAGGSAGVTQYVLDHEGFSACGPGTIYCDDGDARPFATDASKFALFSAGVAEAVTAGAFGALDVIHLHDWHAAMVLVLRAFDPRHAALRDVRCVFTVHNLALQGIRPLRGDPSSLQHWFPRMRCDETIVGDRRWPDCVNPMAAGIRLADAVSTVSPGYAREILEPNDVEGRGRHGGEGLEDDLRAVAARGDLVGILNGCEYPDHPPAKVPSWPDLVALMRAENLRFAAARSTVASAHFVADARLASLGRKRPRPILVTVGRITEQKLGLLRVPVAGAPSALDAVLDAVGEDGLYVILGSGEAALEQFLVTTSARSSRLVFLRGYTEALPDTLYACGDLFMMPSTYEPCGISQMLAMRAGQPCLVHAVGGLKDTVRDGVDGFSFEADSIPAQAEAMVATAEKALTLRAQRPQRWAAVREAAMATRFSWAESARRYQQLLYAAR